MPRKLRLEKVGVTTKVTEYYTENPNAKNFVSIFGANLTTDKDKVCVSSIPSFSFKIDELEDNFGAITLEQLLEEFRLRNLFLPQENEDAIGMLTLNISQSNTIVQSNLLIGKESIDLVVVANQPQQNIENYNPDNGSFKFDVQAGDTLTIFYTN